MSILNQIAESLGLIEPAPASTPIQQVANSTAQTDRPEPPQVNTVNTSAREQPGKQAYILTAATASPDWLLVRDQHMGHLMTCATCYAPTGRYCATGADLRQQYESAPILMVLDTTDDTDALSSEALETRPGHTPNTLSPT